MDFQKLIDKFKNCPCGQKHECGIKDIRIGSGITGEVGDILRKNAFPAKLLLVADKTTLEVARGIQESLKDFELTLRRSTGHSLSTPIPNAVTIPKWANIRSCFLNYFDE